MRGSPLFRAIFCLGVLLVMALPLWRLTGAREPHPPSPAIDEESGSVEEVRFHIALTRPPREIKVSHLGKEICNIPSPGAEAEGALRLSWPEEGVDLRWKIDWPQEDALAGARIQLTGPDGTVHERAIWSRAAADEILTFP